MVEFRGAWTKLLPEQVSEADKLNGIQYRGFAVLGASAERHIGIGQTKWSQWKDISTQSAPQTAKTFRTATIVSWEGLFVTMEQRNDQWFFSLLDPLGLLQDSEDFNPDSMAASKRSCAVLMSANPLEGR